VVSYDPGYGLLMRAARALAWGTLTALVAWSVWYFAARWWPAQCRVDGCVEQDGPGQATLRYGMWASALAFSAVSAAMARPKFQATARRVALTAALALTCFAVVVGTLGELFPPEMPPIYGE
jgi:hypothetical protein